MKKNLFLIAAVLFAAFALVSCVEEPQDGGVGIATIKFSVQDSAKSIGRDNQALDGCSYWEYTASKKTAKEFNVGEATDKSFALSDDLGPFSLGDWTFTLKAYNNFTDKKLMFSGSADATLTKGSTNRVSVVMKPSVTSDGAGEIRIASPLPVDDVSGVFANTIKIYEGTSAEGALVNETNTALGSGSVSFSVKSGKHLVEVSYVVDGTTYASGKIVVTVYDNLVTDITGTLAQLLASASFDVSVSEDPNDAIYFDSAYGVSDGASYTYTFSFGDIYGVDPTSKTTVTAVSKNSGMVEISLEPKVYEANISDPTFLDLGLTSSGKFEELTIKTNIGKVDFSKSPFDVENMNVLLLGDRTVSLESYLYNSNSGEIILHFKKGSSNQNTFIQQLAFQYANPEDHTHSDEACKMEFKAGSESVSMYFSPRYDSNGALYEYSYKDVFGKDVPDTQFFSGWYDDEKFATPSTVGDSYNRGDTYYRYARLEDLSVLTNADDNAAISSKADIAVGGKYKIDGHEVMCVYKSDSPQFWGQFLFVETSSSLSYNKGYKYAGLSSYPTETGVGYGKANTEKLKASTSSEKYSVGTAFKNLCGSEETLKGWFIPSHDEVNELLNNFTHFKSIFDSELKTFLTSTSISGGDEHYVYTVDNRTGTLRESTSKPLATEVRLFRAL